MEVRLLAFAQARDVLGLAERVLPATPEETPRILLRRHWPAVAPESWRVALDGEYRDWDAPLGDAREMALIPPVSGG